MTTRIKHRPVLMLVEDDQDDQELARLANRKLASPYDIVMVQDGVDALDYLRNAQSTQNDSERPLPSLLLVDLDMPRMNGLSFLKTLREEKGLKHLPVVIFTTSKAERDISECYENGCNSYMVKPMNITGLVETLESLADYWFGCVRLPA